MLVIGEENQKGERNRGARMLVIGEQGSKFHLSVSPGQVDFPPDN